MDESHFDILQVYKKIRLARHQREASYKEMMGVVYTPVVD
tara:strand:- start:440 stop:559 length:120 start_codon:yes stop_codon:yes gene_type:complete